MQIQFTRTVGLALLDGSEEYHRCFQKGEIIQATIIGCNDPKGLIDLQLKNGMIAYGVDKEFIVY